MKKAFSLIEILIVVAVLGILAAIVLPTFQGQSLQAKEAVAKDNLRILRNVIELYASRHNDVAPGRPANNPSQPVGYLIFATQLVKTGKYLPKLPTNPFNNKSVLKIIQDNEDFPTEPYMVDTFGWVYKAATREIRLNWSGTDSTGVAYFNY